MSKVNREPKDIITRETWDFKRSEILSEINELVFLAKLSNEDICSSRCQELAEKYKIKSEHFMKCAVSKKQSDNEELADVVTAVVYGRRPN